MSERPGNFNKVSTTKASIGDLEPDSPDEYYAEIEAKIEEALPKVDVIIHLEPSWCRFEEAAQSKL